MKLTLFLSSLFIFSNTSLACEVTGPKLIVFSKEKHLSNPSDSFEISKCNEKNEKALKRFLNDFEGTLNQRSIFAETGLKVRLNNQTQIIEINSLLNERLKKEKEWRFTSGVFTGHTNGLLTVKETQSLNVSCNQCTHTGNKNIKVEIVDGLNSRYQNHWVQAELAAKTTALFPKRSIPVNNQALTPGDFETKTIYHSRPEQFFTEAKQLVFYKVNKPKSNGEPIQFQDLTPVNLVKMGQPATVILKNNGLRLETIAIPSQSGKLGQQVRLKNTRTQKTIIGKVINFNKVEVEL